MELKINPFKDPTKTNFPKYNDIFQNLDMDEDMFEQDIEFIANVNPINMSNLSNFQKEDYNMDETYDDTTIEDIFSPQKNVKSNTTTPLKSNMSTFEDSIFLSPVNFSKTPNKQKNFLSPNKGNNFKKDFFFEFSPIKFC
jgi:hypothetical protein